MGLFSLFSNNKNQEKNQEKKLESKIDGEKIFLKKPFFTSRIEYIPESDSFEIEDIFVEPGQYFRAKETILTVGSLIHGSGILSISLPFSGQLEKIYLETGGSIGLNEQILSVIKIENNQFIENKLFEQNKEQLNQTEVGLLTDEFTDEKTICFTKIAGQETQYFHLYRHKADFALEFLGLTFTNHNGYPYLSLVSTSKELPLSKGDSIIFLFENKEKLEIVFNSASNGKGYWRTNNTKLTSESLQIFLKSNLVKAKISNNRKNIYDIYVLDHEFKRNYNEDYQPQYYSLLEGQYLIKLMTSKFIKINLDNKI
ncbi:hypothetical protein [Maribacter sp. 4G9]|uniref:hypothetical protein n=1 Tax=Maribacter sp. 4G9 TaxID=1889777 RepID=UPI000C14DBFE|nr:hypothetical protein [Maribacter sp. 4G9]PIB39083.1 hypothetical protein BFP75_00985 [Maribacter sp. 4G9]